MHTRQLWQKTLTYGQTNIRQDLHDIATTMHICIHTSCSTAGCTWDHSAVVGYVNPNNVGNKYCKEIVCRCQTQTHTFTHPQLLNEINDKDISVEYS